MDLKKLSGDELVEQLDDLCVKLGLQPFQRTELVSEVLKLVHDYQACVYADVPERIGPGCLEESGK
jgi:hypothetical protein